MHTWFAQCNFAVYVEHTKVYDCLCDKVAVFAFEYLVVIRYGRDVVGECNLLREGKGVCEDGRKFLAGETKKGYTESKVYGDVLAEIFV